MSAIQSGSTIERITRSALMLVLINGFAIAYLWDGYVGYPRKNAIALAKSLGLEADPEPVINPKLTESQARRLMSASDGETGDLSIGELGRPSLEHGGDRYYLGPGGHLRIQADNAKVEWVNGKHTETDLAWQRGIGFTLLVPGIICLFHFIRVVTARVRVDESGLKAPGAKLIPLSAITAVQRTGGRSGTAVTVRYANGTRSGSVELDDYRVKAYGEIVAAICGRTGLPNPLERTETASQSNLRKSDLAEK